MSLKQLSLFALTILLAGPIVACGSKPKTQNVPKPKASPVIDVAKPLNKAKDTANMVEQESKQREQMNPEKAPE